jgi:Na+/H+ antiporter NhaD/arsenite permease-like protein
VLLLALVLTVGTLSALFVNDTICLVFTPIVIDVAEAWRHRPLPYLLALATASNIGSVATVTGNPQNMLIGTVSGISYSAFSAALLPIATAGLELDALIIWFIFRNQLRTLSTDEVAVDDVVPHGPVLVKAVIVATGMLTASWPASIQRSSLRPAPRRSSSPAAFLRRRSTRPSTGVFNRLAPLGLRTIAGLSATDVETSRSWDRSPT